MDYTKKEKKKVGRKARASINGYKIVTTGESARYFAYLYLLGSLTKGEVRTISAWEKTSTMDSNSEIVRKKDNFQAPNNGNIYRAMNNFKEKGYVFETKEEREQRNLYLGDFNRLFFENPKKRTCKTKYAPTIKWLKEFCQEEKIFEDTRLLEPLFDFIERVLDNSVFERMKCVREFGVTKQQLKQYRTIFDVITSDLQEYLLFVMDLKLMFGGVEKFCEDFRKKFKENENSFDDKRFISFTLNYPGNEEQKNYRLNFLSKFVPYDFETNPKLSNNLEEYYKLCFYEFHQSNAYDISIILSKILQLQGVGNSTWKFRFLDAPEFVTDFLHFYVQWQ